MSFLGDWFFKGLCWASVTGLFYYVFGLAVAYESAWRYSERFLTLFGTGFMVSALTYVIHSVKEINQLKKSDHLP